MITCPYCSAANLDEALECRKCGAPRRHDQPQGLPHRITTIFREWTTQATDDKWPVCGYDASSWNGDQDGNITRTMAQFAFLRGGYSNKGLDPRLNAYRENCSRYGIEFGVYWYCCAGYDWKQHAQSFYNVWKAAPGKLPPVLDFESTTLGKKETSAWLYSMVHQFEELAGQKVMIYTSPGWWNAHTIRQTWPRERALWVAHWTIASSPTLPYDWNSWTFWQHSADGNQTAHAYGFINGDPDIDLNRFNGSVNSFNSKYMTNIQPIGESLPPPVLVSDIVPLYKVQVTTQALNVRAAPSVNSADLGDLKSGDILPVTEERDGWCHVEGWISKAYTKEV